MPGEREQVVSALAAEGIRGSEDFGRFVSNTAHFRPSELDERAAMPVLVSLLPTATDPAVVAAIARHLRRPWARPSAFPALLHAFKVWAADSADGDVGWALGDSLANASTQAELSTLLMLSTERRYGRSRQMIVHCLWRFRRDPRVAGALSELVRDRDVSLQAMSALRRAVGNQDALPILREVRDNASDPEVRSQAAKAVKAAEKASPR